MNKKFFNLSLVAVLIIGGIIASFVYKQMSTRPMYDTAKVTIGSISENLNLTGKIVPENSADLGFERGGKVVTLAHEVGDYVTVGTQLASANNIDIKAQYDQAQSLVQSAQANLDYYKQLVKKEKNKLDSLKHTDAISSDKDAQKDQIKASEAQVDAQVAQLAAAEAGAESAKAQLAKAVIAAPFAGVISRQDIKVGETAQNNIPVITLISRDSFKIEIFASQIEVQDLKIGDAAQVTLDDNSGSYVAKITAIDPAESVLNNVSNYKVTLNFIDPVSGLRSGVGANALVTGKTKNNIVAVPQSAVFKADGKNFVFVLQNGLQEQKEVQLGIVGTDGQVEVTGGLSAGDSILILKN